MFAAALQTTFNDGLILLIIQSISAFWSSILGNTHHVSTSFFFATPTFWESHDETLLAYLAPLVLEPFADPPAGVSGNGTVNSLGLLTYSRKDF